MKFNILFIGAFVVSACSSTVTSVEPVNDLTILSFTQGKMTKVDDEWVIYEQTDDMTYEINDTCTYNKRPSQCLRHGFKIQYDSNGKDIRLECIARTNITVNAGNVAREKYVDTNQDDFYMPLDGAGTEFINPQYVISQRGLEDLYIETTCKNKDEVVLEFHQRIRF